MAGSLENGCGFLLRSPSFQGRDCLLECFDTLMLTMRMIEVLPTGIDLDPFFASPVVHSSMRFADLYEPSLSFAFLSNCVAVPVVLCDFDHGRNALGSWAKSTSKSDRCWSR